MVRILWNEQITLALVLYIYMFIYSSHLLYSIIAQIYQHFIDIYIFTVTSFYIQYIQSYFIMINIFTTHDKHNFTYHKHITSHGSPADQLTNLRISKMHQINNPTMQHFVTELCTLLLKSGTLCDMGLVHCGICEMGRFKCYWWHLTS